MDFGGEGEEKEKHGISRRQAAEAEEGQGHSLNQNPEIVTLAFKMRTPKPSHSCVIQEVTVSQCDWEHTSFVSVRPNS